MTLKTDIDQLAADAVIMHDIIHGTSGQTVSTDGGAVKTVAKAVADAEAAIITGAESYLDQCQAETALATAQAQTATNQAAAAAGYAADALSVVSQDLSAINQSVFAATIVDAFLYDTEKDSDGGAWRKRCAHTSWENETLSGNWLGSAANEAAARAISGATTGSYYYDTTAAGFRSLNAGSGVTQVYRGNVRQFPAKVLITVEAARVVLWDLTQAGAPMWMVFLGVGSASGIIPTESGYANAVYAVNGVMALALIAGSVNSAQAGVVQIKFVQDAVYRHTIDANYSGRWVSNLSLRNNSTPTTASWFGTVGYVVNNVCNDVAMTVLPSAPVDVATGLPVPTIAVATNGGVSVIKDDGNVWDITATSYSVAGNVRFRADGKLVFTLDSAASPQRHVHVYAIPTADVSTGAAGYVKGSALEFYANDSGDLVASPSPGTSTVMKIAAGAVGGTYGVARIVENPATSTKGLIAYITKDYNSGWQVGAIKGAWLADTVAETKTGGTDTDRSVNANDLTVNGSLTKAAVASGAELVGYSGFSAANYLEQPYNPDLDFGTGDFCIMGWIHTPSAADALPFYRGAYSSAGTFGLIHQFSGGDNGKLRFFTGAGTNFASASTFTDARWHFFCFRRTAGIGYWHVDTATAVSAANVINVSSAAGTFVVGTDSNRLAPFTGKVALLRASATAPSDEQIAHIYETERHLFEANAQCCLAGSSNAVTALAYDDATDLLHVGTSYGRSTFKGLALVDSEATAVGAITALSASGGVIAQGGASGADVYVPAYTLREELLRDAEQMAKFGQNLIAHDFTATASQEVFTLPVGWEIVAVYQQGTLKRETTAWVRTFDGFKWSVDLVTGATVSDWISIMARRVSK